MNVKSEQRVQPERIRARLIALGKDPIDGGQTWLAREVGMKPQGIQSIMAGDSKRPRKLMEIAKALQTSEAYLLGDSAEAVHVDPNMAIRLADLFASVMKAPIDLQNQVAAYIEGRLKANNHQSRETATKQAS